MGRDLRTSQPGTRISQILLSQATGYSALQRVRPPASPGIPTPIPTRGP